jgi:hypothetical protein
MRDLKEQFFEAIREAKVHDGLTFEIVIIKEGKSKNGTYYPKETLLKARELFEGAKVAYYEWNGNWDHLSEEQRAQAPAGFPSQVAGVVEGVRFKKVDGGEYGLVGTLKLTESNRWLAEIFKLGIESGNKEVLGFSIDVLGDVVREKVGSEEVDVVKEIGIVNEITVVTNPAAGGKLERMVASVKAKKEETAKMKDALLRVIAALRPKKLDGVSLTEADESKVKELAVETIEEAKKDLAEGDDLSALLQDLAEACQRGDAKRVIEVAQTIIDKHGGQMTKKEQETQTPAPAPDVTELKQKQESTEARLAESEKRICEATLRATLAESNLPEAARVRLRERWTGKTFTDEELKKDIEAEVKYCAALAESLHPSGLRVEVTADQGDKLGDAIEGMIKGEDVNKVPRFKSIHEAFAKTEKINPYDGNFKDRCWLSVVSGSRIVEKKRVLKEAIQTSSFGEVLGDRLHKRMVAEYQEAGMQDWRKLCNVVSVGDFLTNRVTRLGGYGTNMPAVSEAGTYTALTSPTDEEATYSVTKRGGLESISMEAIKNDNLRALQLIPKRLGRGAANTLYQFVFELINPATNPTIYDAAALYVAGHGNNLRTVALSYSEFNAIAVVLFDQTGYNEANFFPATGPKYLVVPNELWLTATEIAKSNVSFSGARTETVPNAFSEWNVEVIRAPYWTDANNYVTMADPKVLPGMEIAFLDGNEEPELLQEAANSGSDFTADQIRYKLRHIYGGAITDWRPFVGSVVA